MTAQETRVLRSARPLTRFSWRTASDSVWRNFGRLLRRVTSGLVVLVLLLAMNAVVILIRNRYQKRW